jgi:hypothetical protein
MKILICTLSLLLVGLTTFANPTCQDIFAEQTVVYGAEGKRLPPMEPIRLADGETVWGFYDCSSCETTNSARPNVHGRQQCRSCGVPRTTEAYYPPAVMRKDGALYLVDPGNLVRSQAELELTQSGSTTGCPFCGASNFRIEVQCPGCGAQVTNASDLARSARNSVSSLALNQSRASSPRSAPRVTEPSQLAGASTAAPSGDNTQARSLRNRLVGAFAGATMLVATGVGTVWGLQTSVERGLVTAVHANHVVVEYTDQGHRVELERNSNESVQWRLGEEVDLYFVNWRMGQPSGAERLNGEVYRPQSR